MTGGLFFEVKMKDFKENRALSFAILFFVYAACAVLGILIYKNMTGGFWFKILVADIAATVLCFVFSLIFRNASVYDPYWSVQPLLIMACCAAGCKMNLLSWLMFAAIFYWGIRLTSNWAYTFANLNAQDWRYTMLKEQTKFFYPLINFIGIHMVPTLIVYCCTMPAVFVVMEGAAFKWPCLIFVLISFGAATLQLFADYQMHSYRRNRNGPFNRNGLWHYSRHPNYLGEISMWWGIAGAAVFAMPDKKFLLFGAAINTVLFLSASIPLAERRQSKKEGFAEYKKKTHLLFILPVKD